MEIIHAYLTNRRIGFEVVWLVHDLRQDSAGKNGNGTVATLARHSQEAPGKGCGTYGILINIFIKGGLLALRHSRFGCLTTALLLDYHDRWVSSIEPPGSVNK